MKKTLTYNDNVNGFTSFHSYLPDWLTRCNNRFLTIKDGQLWLHNDEDNPVRNNFYGTQFASKITTVLNPDNSEDKIFKTLVLEGTHPWETSIKTNYSESAIKTTEYNKRESRWFSYIRKNENNNDLHGGKAQGIGVVTNINTLGLSLQSTITFIELSTALNIGDTLFQLNGNLEQIIGVITNITQFTIVIASTTTIPLIGLFCFATKNARIEGSEIRGYYALVALEQNTTEPCELFAIESNIVKSYV